EGVVEEAWRVRGGVAWQALGRALAGGAVHGPHQRREAELERVRRVVRHAQQAVLQVVAEVVRLDALAPALDVDARVLRPVVEAAVGHRLEVVEGALVAVVALVAALAQAQAEVNVLVAVAERGVEAAGLLERPAAEQRAATRDDLEAARLVDRRVAGGEAGVEVPREAVLADDDAGVLDGVVGKEQLGADDGRGGVSRRVAGQSVQPAVLREGVVVQEDQKVAAGGGGPAVAGGG